MGHQSKHGPAIDPDDDDDGGQPRRRIVPAANQPMPKTTALPSVWGAPAPKKRRSLPPPLDIDSLAIRTGVPIPAPLRSKPGVHRYQRLFDRMPVGAMVELPERNATAFMAWAKATSHHGQLARRKLRDGIAGVWRLAPGSKAE